MNIQTYIYIIQIHKIKSHYFKQLNTLLVRTCKILLDIDKIMVVQLKFGTYFWYVERVNLDLDKIMVVQIKFGTYFWYVY